MCHSITCMYIRRERLTYNPKDRAEHNSQQNKPSVPIVVIVHSGNTKEHKDDGLGRGREHLHCILYCRMGLVRYIPLNVVFHRYTTECYPERFVVF